MEKGAIPIRSGAFRAKFTAKRKNSMAFQILRRFWWVILILFIGPVTNTFSQSAVPTATPTVTTAPTVVPTGAPRDTSLKPLTIIVSDEDLLSPELIEALTTLLSDAGYGLHVISEADYAADPEAVSSEFRPVLRFFDDG